MNNPNKSQQQSPNCGHTKITKGCKECDTLFQEWNAKLEASGHEDIEDFTMPDVPLKVWDNLFFRGIDPEVLAAKLNYYAQCRELLNTQLFENETHRQIWELHSEGIGLHKIVKILNKKKFKKSTVTKIINFYKMGIM